MSACLQSGIPLNHCDCTHALLIHHLSIGWLYLTSVVCPYMHPIPSCIKSKFVSRPTRYKKRNRSQHWSRCKAEAFIDWVVQNLIFEIDNRNGKSSAAFVNEWIGRHENEEWPEMAKAAGAIAMARHLERDHVLQFQHFNYFYFEKGIWPSGIWNHSETMGVAEAFVSNLVHFRLQIGQ